MDLSCEGVLIKQQVLESPGIFVPDTPAKSDPMKRTLISLSNGEGISAFQSVVDVPVVLLTPSTEESGSSSSNMISNPPLAPITPNKGRSAQQCKAPEVHLDPEGVNTKERVEECDMSQKVVIEDRIDASSSSDDSEEMQEIDLNKMPRKKTVRRKKHRPRVIQERKPIKNPGPITPKIAEPKDRPITKKTYVRKKKALTCSDMPTCSSEKSKEQTIPLKTYVRKRKILNLSETPLKKPEEVAEKSADQLPKSTTESVRRSLNFGSEGEAIDECRASTASDVKSTAFEHFDCNTTTNCNREFNVELAQGMKVKVTRSPAGFAFDLNRSLNEILDEYIKLPENPTPSDQTTENNTNVISDRKQFASCSNSDIIIIDDIEKSETNKDHGHISVAEHSPVKEFPQERCIVHGYNETKQNISFQETSGLSPYFPMIYKRRRTQRPKLSSSSSFEDAQQSTNFDKSHQLELTLPSTQRATRKRSKVLTQSHKRIPTAGAEDCDHLLCYPEKENYGPQACIDALFADTRLKVTTKRRRNKGSFHLVSSMLSNGRQEYEIASSPFTFPQPPFVLGLATSKSSRWMYLKRIQVCSNIQGVAPCLDPVDVIIEKMKHMKISDAHIKNIGEASNALVSYRGGSMMVPYMHLFDMIKKQRPRAKVSLDPETNRVWNLLMGKKSNGEAEGVNADKEKWWEAEREVFRGRADAFIARMHLILGDRRFSKWNGSVVDSVVGVFLTQNVSDHLSSSAFMSLAARYPLRPCNGKEGNERTMKTSTEQGDGSVSSLIEPKATDPCSALSDGKEKETCNAHGALGSNNRNGTCHSKDNDSHIHGREQQIGSDQAPHNRMVTTVTPIPIVDLEEEEEEEDKMTLEDAISSKTGHVGMENVSAPNEELGLCLLPSASKLSESNDTNIIESGIGPQRMASNLATTSAMQIIDLAKEEDIMLLKDVISSKNEHVRMENVSVLDEELGPCLLSSASEITESYDINIIGSSIDPQIIPSNFTTAMAVESHESSSNLSMDGSTCLDTEVYLRNHIICHKDLPCEKSEDLVGENDSHELPQVHDKQPVEFLKDFQAKSICQEVNIKETIYPSLCNDVMETLETVEATEMNLKNEVHNSQNAESKKVKSASNTEKANTKTENTKTFDWEDLRREALANSSKKGRSRETMDSLDWEGVRDADVDEISKTIRERGMNNVLAGRIKDFLNRLVKEHGSIDLEWLRNVPPDKSKEYLLSIYGLGLKSVECVRLLTLHHLAFPVDTNVGRICVRLGWVPLQPLPESLQLHLLELYPMIEHIQKYLWPRLCTLDQRTLYELHYQMITFGKVFCTKTKPNCNACPMRGECKHFASAFASARLALPGPEEKRLVTSRIPSAFEDNRSTETMPPLQIEGTQPTKGNVSNNCEPIIDEPASPEHICTESLERDIEDAFYEDPEDIPTIKLSLGDFKENLKNYMEENNMAIQDGDMSKALVAITAEAASIPMPKLKNVNRLRTEHQVYELPDSHLLLEGMDQRVPDDPCPYLLAIWTPGETARSTEPPQSCSNSQDSSKLCGRKTCFACNSIQEARAQTVRGTFLIPCRTAMKGSFPLNGTYFQVNEVFADHSSSRVPIDIPRGWIWNLPRRTVFFGTSVSTIFKGLTLEEIQHCFWRGFVCVRGFDRASRGPRPLYARLHCPPSKAVKNRKTSTNEDKASTSSKIL